jgi:DNA-binding MarR family transcriptional regulator
MRKSRGDSHRRPRARKKAKSDRISPARLGRLSEQVGYLLRRASAVFSAHWALQFEADETVITPVQCGMMILVDENPGLTQIELARLLRVEGSTLWQMVDRLLDLGFIHRRRLPDDRRAYAIRLSQRGQKALQRFERRLRLHQQALLDCLQAKERVALSAMLSRVIEEGDRLNEGGAPQSRPSKRP